MRVYVTGGTGFVGSNLVKLYSEWHGLDVVAAGRRPPDRELPGRFAELDVCDGAAVRSSITIERPDVIVHAAILNDFRTMYADRRLAWDVYVESTRSLIDAANELGSVFVFISTDWVFDGSQPGADETTPPNPVNYYGVLKAAGELVTLERAREPIVARIAGVNGIPWARREGPRSQDPGFGHYISVLVDALSQGAPFTVWEGDRINQRATPSLASECGEMILQLVRAGARGVFHCCGGESMTRMELARTAVDVFGLDPGLLRTGPPDPDALLPAPVPRDTSLSASRTADRIGYSLPSARLLMETLRYQQQSGIVSPVDSTNDRSARQANRERSTA